MKELLLSGGVKLKVLSINAVLILQYKWEIRNQLSFYSFHISILFFFPLNQICIFIIN